MATMTSSPVPLSSCLPSFHSFTSPLRFPSLSKHMLCLQGTRYFRCSANPQGGRATPPVLLKLAVSGVTELLRLLSPKKTREDSSNGAASVAHSVDEVIGILRSDYERAYFLTGNFTTDIYAEDCLFEDPTIRFHGKDQYAQNLDLLVPFFDRPSLELEKIEKGCSYEMNFILAAWKLSICVRQLEKGNDPNYQRTYLKFPWRPLISIRGETIYDLDEEFTIVRHAESWNISALDAVGQIFTFSSREFDG